ncbi:MAG: hypothetical protein ACRDPE_02065 [Solirubrobacterales bacterium]
MPGCGPTGTWIAAWTGGAAIGMVNGTARELTYGRVLSEPAANRLSALSAIGAFLLYFEALQRVTPLRTRRQAVAVGGAWLAMTVCFEFGLGRLRGRSWRELGAGYDLRRGRLWPFVLVTLAVGPELARRRSSR